MKKSLPPLLWFCCSIVLVPLQAADLFVPGQYTNIQEAMDAAGDGDRVLVGPGEYLIQDTLNFNRLHDPDAAEPVPVKNLTVQSTDGAEATIIEFDPGAPAAESGPLILFQSGETGDSVLDGFTLRLAKYAISCEDSSSPQLKNLIVTGCNGFAKAGIFCKKSSPTIDSCVISDNFGGGIETEGKLSYPVIQNCEIIDNGDVGFSNPGAGIATTLEGGFHLIDSTVRGNASNKSPGGIYINRSGNAKLERVEVTDNPGGGIYADSNASLTCTDLIVQGNTGFNSGGGIYLRYANSSIFNNCRIIGNSSSQSGAGIYCGDEVEIECNDVEIKNNITYGDGGGIFFAEEVAGTFLRVDISGNSAENGGGIYFGDARFNVAFNDLLMNHNTAMDKGGGCYLQGYDSQLTFQSCDLSWNRAEFGGWLYIKAQSSGAAHIVDSVIQGNQAWDSGGFLYSEGVIPGQVSVDRGTLSGNWAANGGSVAYAKMQPARWTNSIVWNNPGQPFSGVEQDIHYSCIEGDALFPGEANINDDPLFCGWPDGEASVSNQFEFEQVLGEFSYSLATSSPCLSAGQDGGNIGANLGVCTVTGSDSLRIQLLAGEFDVVGLPLFQKVSLIGAGRELTTIAGTVVGLRGDSVLQDLTVTDGRCGGVWIGAYGNPTMCGCAFVGNNGPGILVTDHGYATIIDSESVGNEAEFGGGILIQGGAGASVSNTLIKGNKAETSGGGVYCEEGAAPIFTDCEIIQNWALCEGYEYQLGGGGVAIRGEGSPLFSGCLISANRAGDNDTFGSGGGVNCQEGTTARFVQCRIQENSATGNGGGGLCYLDANVHFDDCILFANMAASKSGGILCVAASPVLENCMVVANTSPYAAVISSGTGEPILDHTILWGNAAKSIAVEADGLMSASYCCIEGPEIEPGPGNINLDPLLCGWAGSETWVLNQQELEAVGGAYRLSLAEASPCLTGGEGGRRIGTDTGICAEPGPLEHTLVLGPGSFDLSVIGPGLPIGNIRGQGPDQSTLLGTLGGLSTGTVIKDLAITGGLEGGAIVESDQSVEFINCWITGNAGSGVLCKEGSNVHMTECQISHNEAQAGGGIYCADHATLRLDGCTVSDNIVVISGAGIACRVGVSLTVSGSRIENNTCLPPGGGGGGISAQRDSVINISNTRIIGNSAKYGGALDSSARVTISDSVLSDNISYEGGGGLRCHNFPGIIQNCDISWNRSYGVAGACTGQLQCYDTVFRGNSSALGGGVIELSGESTFRNCTITASMSPGGAFSTPLSSDFSLENCIVWDNWGGSGGFGENADVTFCCIEGDDVYPGLGNINEDPLYCGWPTEVVEISDQDAFQAVFNEYSLALGEGSPCIGTGMDGSDMGVPFEPPPKSGFGSRTVILMPGVYQIGTRSFAQHLSLQGDDPEQVTIEGTLFGMRTGSSVADVTITNGVEGGIRVEGESPEFLRCIIQGNIADNISGHGGTGVVCRDGSPRFTDCQIVDNATDRSGGGVRCVGVSTPYFLNCMIARNNSLSTGGGIYATQTSHPEFEACQVLENSSGSYGGGICGDGDSEIKLVLCGISDNATRIDSGGGIAMLDNSKSRVFYSVLERNKVPNNGGGGALFTSSTGGSHLVGCVVRDNSAIGSGGAFSLNPDTVLLLVNSRVSGNVSKSWAGAAYCSSGSILNAFHCTFYGNSGSDADGFYGDRSSPRFYNCILADGPATFGDMGDVTMQYSYVHPDTGVTGPGVIYSDPMLDSNFGLQPGSPCIDAGSNSIVPEDRWDLDGDGDTAERIPFDALENSRFFDDPSTVDSGEGAQPIADMGAIEFQGGEASNVWITGLYPEPGVGFVIPFSVARPEAYSQFLLQWASMPAGPWQVEAAADLIDDDQGLRFVVPFPAGPSQRFFRISAQ